MFFKNDPKTEIKVPKHKPIVNHQQIRSSTSMANPRPNLWSPQKLDRKTNEYDIISSQNKEQDSNDKKQHEQKEQDNNDEQNKEPINNDELENKEQINDEKQKEPINNDELKNKETEQTDQENTTNSQDA